MDSLPRFCEASVEQLLVVGAKGVASGQHNWIEGGHGGERGRRDEQA